MKTRTTRWLLAVTALAAAAACSADIPPPDRGPRAERRVQQQAPQVKIEIVPLEDEQAARIEIPGNALNRMGAGAAAGTTSGNAGGTTGFRTVVSGVALSLALALGGLWVLRRSRPIPGAATAALLLMAGGMGFAASRAWANAAPIFPDREPLPAEVRASLVRGGRGETVRIYLTGAQLERLVRDLRGPGRTSGAVAPAPAGAPAPETDPPPPDTPPTSKK